MRLALGHSHVSVQVLKRDKENRARRKSPPRTISKSICMHEGVCGPWILNMVGKSDPQG